MTDSPVDASTRPIVCGIDFSPESRRALECATALASRLGCPLHLVSAVEPLLTEAARLRNQLGPFTDQIVSDLRAFMGTSPLAPGRVSFESPAGEPAPVLIAAATRIDARLIVVGTRGWGQVARLFLGSTTLRLLRTTERPVLVTDLDGSADVAGAAPGGAVSRVVCGVDFSAGSLAAIDVAARLAADLRVGVTLVHAVPPTTVPVGWDSLVRELEAERLEEARGHLQDLARALTPPPEVRARAGSPADVLAEETAADPHAIVAVGLRGSHHHRPGSTALRIVALTKNPVLAVPEPT